MMSDADQNRNAAAVMEFQRKVVGEILTCRRSPWRRGRTSACATR